MGQEMNTHQLEIFFYVAKYLSVSKAANHLCISQPAVSSQVKKLENIYNIKLLEKKWTRNSTDLYRRAII